MTKDEALKMAIEAMNSAYSSHGKILTSMPAQDAWFYHGCDAKLFKALQACKEALEQPAQEPAAWIKYVWKPYEEEDPDDDGFYPDIDLDAYDNGGDPLYTHPAPSWQGLSDDEMKRLASKAAFLNLTDLQLIELCCAIIRGKNK